MSLLNQSGGRGIWDCQSTRAQPAATHSSCVVLCSSFAPPQYYGCVGWLWRSCTTVLFLQRRICSRGCHSTHTQVTLLIYSRSTSQLLMCGCYSVHSDGDGGATGCVSVSSAHPCVAYREAFTGVLSSIPLVGYIGSRHLHSLVVSSLD